MDDTTQRNRYQLTMTPIGNNTMLCDHRPTLNKQWDDGSIYLHCMPCVRDISEQSDLVAYESIESVLLVSEIPHVLIILGLDHSPVACTIKAQKKYSDRQAKDVHHLQRDLKYKT